MNAQRGRCGGTSVHRKIDAANPPAFIGCEKHGRPRDVPRDSLSAEQAGQATALAPSLIGCAHRRVCVTDHDAVGPDVVPAVNEGPVTRQRLNRRLRRRISPCTQCARGRDGRNVDDGSPASAFEVRDRMPGSEHRCPDVHRHDALPDLKIHGRGTSSTAGQSNVVNHGVEAAQRARTASPTHRALSASLDRSPTTTTPSAPASLIRLTVAAGPFAGYVGYRDSGALAREENGDRLADAEQVTTWRRASTGDKRPLARKAVSRINAPPPRLIIHLDNITQC